ncbi:MAG TPA: hemolysin [Legionella sp.]|nr:hemolysin [Legionella sp.]
MRCLPLSILLCSLCLSGCISDLWTGANLVYDRHNVYIKIDDFKLNADANRALYHDRVFKRDDCSIELAVLNRDILLVGRVPTETLRQEAYTRIKNVPGKRRLFNQLAVNHTAEDPVLDSWITAKIRSQIFADADIDPHKFKVLTYAQIVYLMGDVVPSQAEKVIHFARKCRSVLRVVKLFKYYHLSDKPVMQDTKNPSI